ncbi:MAG TPA: dephospho-CoA kinase [Clostridiaceae bacterium]|nr:dephospho-CoA kinase [Clostridiaceae bacterium]
MRIIGVTGGIGSGKSTVSRILEDLGAVVIDADKISREVTSPGEQAFNEIVNCFGEEYIGQNGQLDRKKLAALVFSHPDKLKLLNSITHKHIIDRILKMIDAKAKEGYNGVIAIDAPIPVEHGFLDTVDEVWVVDAERDVRIKRIMERSNMSYEEAVSRINSQIAQSDYLAVANEVIENNGSVEELEQKVVKLYFSKSENRK